MWDQGWVIAAFCRYKQAVDLGARTRVGAGGASRAIGGGWRDDELCAAAALAVRHGIAREVATRAAGQGGGLRSGWAVAQYRGVQQLAAAQALHCLEEQGDANPRRLAKALGTSVRTLQRQLAVEGMIVTGLRMAARQQRALRLIQRRVPPCLAAAEAGYADQAHMARGFKHACGPTPRQMAGVLAGPMAAGAVDPGQHPG